MKHETTSMSYPARAVLCAAVLFSATSARAEPVPTPAVHAAETADAAAQTGAGTVNINTASAEELERLPGIGPSRARAILELRAQLTRFKRLEELLRVKGIGRATFRRLRPLLSLQGETTLHEANERSH